MYFIIKYVGYLVLFLILARSSKSYMWDVWIVFFNETFSLFHSNIFDIIGYSLWHFHECCCHSTEMIFYQLWNFSCSSSSHKISPNCEFAHSFPNKNEFIFIYASRVKIHRCQKRKKKLQTSNLQYSFHHIDNEYINTFVHYYMNNYFIASSSFILPFLRCVK